MYIFASKNRFIDIKLYYIVEDILCQPRYLLVISQMHYIESDIN
jgi:hypothetical protein